MIRKNDDQVTVSNKRMNFNFNIAYYFIGYFLILGVVILFSTGMSLFLPETFWSKIWFIKKPEYRQMLAYSVLIGCGFWMLAVVMGISAVGWFRKRQWGWVMTICIFLLNGLSDSLRFVTGNYIEGSIGVIITSCIIFYLTRSGVKRYFKKICWTYAESQIHQIKVLEILR